MKFTHANMKNGILISCLLLLPGISNAQPPPESFTLQEVYEMALQHYPLVRKRGLISKSEEYSVQNTFKGHYPNVSLNGQATHQSEVTKIPVELPGMFVKPPARDQYKVYAEINQNLYNGGRIRGQMKLEEVQTAVEEQRLQVDLYKLKERIYQLYFGILLIEQQLEQVGLTKREIQSGIKITKAAIQNGSALKSSLYTLEAELLGINQRLIEMNASWQAYADMLALFIDYRLNKKEMLKMPIDEEIDEMITRPELKLFDLQKETLTVREIMLQAITKPQVGLFLQGGYGRPALNMLSNEFEPYYIGGIRFNWSLAGFYTIKGERELLSLSRQMLDVEKETFRFNTTLSLRQQNAEIRKLQELIETDKKIVALRSEVLASANAQLENGTIKAHDYLSEVLAEERARQNLLLHRIQLLMAKYNFNTIAGN